MTKEQEVEQMCKFLIKNGDDDYIIKESEHNFQIKYIILMYFYPSADTYRRLFRIDFDNKIVTAESVDNPTKYPVDWNEFINSAHSHLGKRIRGIVEQKIKVEEERRIECRLNRRVDLELRMAE